MLTRSKKSRELTGNNDGCILLRFVVLCMHYLTCEQSRTILKVISSDVNIVITKLAIFMFLQQFVTNWTRYQQSVHSVFLAFILTWTVTWVTRSGPEIKTRYINMTRAWLSYIKPLVCLCCLPSTLSLGLRKSQKHSGYEKASDWLHTLLYTKP